MNTSVLNEFVDSNRAFFFKKNRERDGARDGVILVDLQTTNAFVACSVMKISAAVSDILNQDIIVVSAMRGGRTIAELIKSFNPLNVVSAKHLIISGFLRNAASILRSALTINTGDDLGSLKIHGIPVGIHIYDLILARRGLSSIGKMSLSYRIDLIVNLSFFYAISRYIGENKVSYAVLPDTVYRQGLLFEIMKSKCLPSISGIDINGISMHKFESPKDYESHCRVPDMDVVDMVMNNPSLYSNAEAYLSHRTSGQEQQHDALRAYAKDKAKTSKADLINAHGLSPDKKIVLVMSHIFCDAPHAYPKMLFRDYADWLIKTCQRLAGNPSVNFVVKEHPSAALYAEEGTIDRILDSHGFGNKLISKDTNTESLFNSVDVVVTCGGTVGMEFPCYGVPVLVAAKPPYAAFPYVVAPDTEATYYSELDRIHEYNKLSEENMRLAKSVLYVIQSAMKIPKESVGLGSQSYMKGSGFDVDIFLKEMVIDCDSGEGYSALLSAIKILLSGEHKNLVNLPRV